MMQVLSLGGGTQSTALLLMSIDGLFERPDVVIFSDTGSEMPHTYETVNHLEKLCNDANIPFYIVQSYFGKDARVSGSWKLHEYYLNLGMLPMVGNPRCTFNFKIYPVRRKVRELLKIAEAVKDEDGRLCQMWIGITTDERSRSEHAADLKWATNRYPLLELDMNRQDCIDYIAKNHPTMKVSKSGCFMCPYQSPKSWAKLKRLYPEKFSFARDMEIAAKANGIRRGLWGTKSIISFDSDFTLEDFGMLSSEDAVCSATSGGCFI
tara:strand:+ start:240 stop:1034 length:795 start_codon:yes stop_codon:yes gene_type:complete